MEIYDKTKFKAMHKAIESCIGRGILRVIRIIEEIVSR